jgi:hypothetical protein
MCGHDCAGTQEGSKYTVTFRIVISVLYTSICTQYINTKIIGLGNEGGKFAMYKFLEL